MVPPWAPYPGASSGPLIAKSSTSPTRSPLMNSVPVAGVIEVLENAGYDGWYVMETDVFLADGNPPEGEGPVRGVERSLAFLRSLAGVGV